MNILLLYCDELRADVFSALGHPTIKTPNFDRLAARSMVLDRAYGVAPVCMASRTSLATGRYPRTNGCMDNSMPAIAGEERLSIYRRFAESGWRTENVGKYHLGWPVEESGFGFHARFHDGFGPFGHAPAGCDPRTVWSRIRRLDGELPIVIWGESPVAQDRTEAAQTVDAGIERLRGYAPSEPFFLCVAPGMPHTPYAPPAPYSRMYDPDGIALPASWGDGIETKPATVQVLYAGRRYQEVTEQDVRRCRASYYGLVSHVDHEIGRVLDALEQSGRADDTVVVLTSDHGTCLGEHGWIEKWAQLWEETVHVPLWISVPGMAPGRSSALVQQFDLGPTLLELCGVPAIEGSRARSLVPLLSEPGRPHRDAVFAETFIPAYMPEPACSIRTERWKMTRYPRQAEVEHRLPYDHPRRGHPMFWPENLVEGELYDLDADPAETRNLLASPDHREVVRQLTERLDQWKAECEPRVAWEEVALREGTGWSQQGLIEGSRARRLTEVWGTTPTRRVE